MSRFAVIVAGEIRLLEGSSLEEAKRNCHKVVKEPAGRLDILGSLLIIECPVVDTITVDEIVIQRE